MGDAYRDDLAAAQLRVQDLEREHAALAARNAALEARATPPAPAPTLRPKRRLTAVEQIVIVLAVVGGAALCAYGHLPRALAKLAMMGIVLTTQGLVLLRRWLKEL